VRGEEDGTEVAAPIVVRTERGTDVTRGGLVCGVTATGTVVGAHSGAGVGATRWAGVVATDCVVFGAVATAAFAGVVAVRPGPTAGDGRAEPMANPRPAVVRKSATSATLKSVRRRREPARPLGSSRMTGVRSVGSSGSIPRDRGDANSGGYHQPSEARHHPGWSGR
jgi:hypothetical protein